MQALARSYTREAIETLATIMKDPDASAGARVSASSALLDRGWGRPLQSIAQKVSLPTLRAEDLTDDELAAIIAARRTKAASSSRPESSCHIG